MLHRKMNLKKVFLSLATTIVGITTGYSQTYSDVRTIFINKCASCHNTQSNETPFPLETFTDISKKLQTIKEVVTNNIMPPWLADPHYREFSNDRSLSKNEKQKIIDWINLGAPEGTPIKGKPNQMNKQNNRPADLSLEIQKPFLVKGDNKEKFVLFKVPFELSEEKNIEAIEFFSNNRRIVHHANYMFCSVPDKSVNLNQGPAFIDDTQNTGIANTSEYESFKKNPVYYTGWIPGTSTEYYPQNFGWKLPKRGVVLFTVHYSGTPIDQNSIIGVKLHFKKAKIEREIRVISLGSGGIGEEAIFPNFIISPNKISTFSLKIRTPEDQSLMYVWPHMHYLGKEFSAYAITPTNDTINLVRIPKWDFKWQEMYRMKKLVKIPAGSLLSISGTYDNTTSNPNNPHSPPVYVFSSGNMISTDEMFTLLLIYSPYKEGDEDIEL